MKAAYISYAMSLLADYANKMSLMADIMQLQYMNEHSC